MSDKQHAHEMLDRLDAGQFAAVEHLLEAMIEAARTGSLAQSLAGAPVEDEQINDKTATAIERARASLRRGERIPHEEILQEFGARP